jgi:AAA+ superfamily predicted ATPase
VFSDRQEFAVTGDRGIETLREAIKLSPDNIPLRRLLAENLIAAGKSDQAEIEFREALTLAPTDLSLKTGLATAFQKQGKLSHAIVILEDVVKQPKAPAFSFIAYARLLLETGDVAESVRQYRKGIDLDPKVADASFADRLGIRVESAYHDSDDDVTTDDVVEGRVRETREGNNNEVEAEIERPAFGFRDVGGMESVKDEIRMKIIHPLTHADLYKAYGKQIGGGILLYGPPGCGKTHLARATAGEIHAGFIAVGISDVLDMWIGNSEKNLHAIFEQARLNKPCVLFFDEVDALAASRNDMRTSAGRQLINQFLSELDGIGSTNDGLLILAATNAPWHLDAAFRRPGRFDRILFVPPPDAAARASILKLLCESKPTQDIDYEQLAKKTENFSGADLKGVLDIAIETKLREAMKAGMPKPLMTRDLLTAAASIKPSTREWFTTARNYALYSNQSGIYDDILKYLKM